MIQQSKAQYKRNEKSKTNQNITLSPIPNKKNILKFDKTEPNFFKRQDEIL